MRLRYQKQVTGASSRCGSDSADGLVKSINYLAEDGGKLGRKLSALELVGTLICVAAGNGWCRNRPVRIWVDNAGSVLIW